MRANQYLSPKYSLPPPRYLPPPTNIPLSEDEYGAEFIPSRLMGPLIDFEIEWSVIPRNVGDCIARKLTEFLDTEDPWIYKQPDDRHNMTFTNTTDTKTIWVVMPEFANDELDGIDFRDPTSWQQLENIRSEYLSLIARTETPVYWKVRSKQPEFPNYAGVNQQPSYFKKKVEFMEARTPAFIQKVRDELSRRYIVMTHPQDPELKLQFFKAMEACRFVKQTQRLVERRGLAETSHFKGLPNIPTKMLSRFVGPAIRTRKTRKARKTRKGRR